MKLALAIIVKDELDEIKRILKDYSSIFDEVHIAVDFNFAEFEKLKESYPNLHVYQYTWCNDFSHKRNFLASKIECEYYFRMDCDDVILHPENVRKTAELAAKDKISIVYSFYEYAFDQDGNIIAGHYRETIIRNDGSLEWNKPVHENLLSKDPFNQHFVMDKSFKIKHQKSSEAEDNSAFRNIDILVDEYNKDGKNTDPRTIAYLGRNFLGVGEFDKAMFFLSKHIMASGWNEDRYMSRLQLAECHMHKEQIEEAKLCCMEAIMELPENPDAYLKLHDIYFELSDWKKAIYWGTIGMSKNPPEDSVMLYDPSSLTWRPAITMAYSYFQTNEYDKAWALFQYAQKLAPTVDFIVHNEAMFREAVEHKNFAEKFLYLANYIKEKAPDRIKQLFDVLPRELDDNAYIQRARNKMLPPNEWGKDSIVIYCGPVLEEWYDKSVESGIGGSEEAVIYLSRELTKLGYKVTVFNGCGENEGVHSGVSYQSFMRFNPRDTFNIIISWRMSIFAMPIKSKHSWVWFHDVLPTKNFQRDHLANVDKVIVLSEFHKSLLPPYVPESKILVSSNGINDSQFLSSDVIRCQHRAIYASSYDRGLEELLTIWPKVREAIPDAELYIYYGWNNIDKMIKSGDYKIAAFKEKIMKLLDQPGVFECGRIGHKELIAEYQKSAIYAYPCTYEEISCISAMKAQASGCYPVTTNYAALGETVKSGISVDKSDMEAYTKHLIDAMLNPKQITYIPTTWKDVAAQWSNLLT
jgi:glycosyltransferase involved in cell wall biosynthesis